MNPAAAQIAVGRVLRLWVESGRLTHVPELFVMGSEEGRDGDVKLLGDLRWRSRFGKASTHVVIRRRLGRPWRSVKESGRGVLSVPFRVLGEDSGGLTGCQRN